MGEVPHLNFVWPEYQRTEVTTDQEIALPKTGRKLQYPSPPPPPPPPPPPEQDETLKEYQSVSKCIKKYQSVSKGQLANSCHNKAIPIKFFVARVPHTQNFQKNTKILKHFHLIRIIKLGEIISNFLLKYFHLIRII